MGIFCCVLASAAYVARFDHICVFLESVGIGGLLSSCCANRFLYLLRDILERDRLGSTSGLEQTSSFYIMELSWNACGRFIGYRGAWNLRRLDLRFQLCIANKKKGLRFQVVRDRTGTTGILAEHQASRSTAS